MSGPTNISIELKDNTNIQKRAITKYTHLLEQREQCKVTLNQPAKSLWGNRRLRWCIHSHLHIQTCHLQPQSYSSWCFSPHRCLQENSVSCESLKGAPAMSSSWGCKLPALLRWSNRPSQIEDHQLQPVGIACKEAETRAESCATGSALGHMHKCSPCRNKNQEKLLTWRLLESDAPYNASKRKQSKTRMQQNTSQICSKNNVHWTR